MLIKVLMLIQAINCSCQNDVQCKPEGFCCIHLYRVKIIQKVGFPVFQFCNVSAEKHVSKNRFLLKAVTVSIHTFFQQKHYTAQEQNEKHLHQNLQDCYHTKLVFQSHLYTQPQNCFICNNKHLKICKFSRWEILLHEYGFVTDSVKECMVTKHTHMHCSVISDTTVNQHITKTLQNAYHRWLKQQHEQ
jgi:hypothetical protein